MDYFGYRSGPHDNGKTPGKRIVAKRMVWDLAKGMHPYLIESDSAVWEIDPFHEEVNGRVGNEWQLDPRGIIDGHNVAVDGNITKLLEVDAEVPLSPLFVRDLAGRSIYIGPGPERKSLLEWESYGALALNQHDELANPLVSLVVFPRWCHPASRVQGHELLESVFMTKFRTLDMGRDYPETPSGAEGNDALAVRAEYPLANFYPYKYRLDTFYIDGWKLPQTQMLFAKWQGVRPSDAKSLGEKFMAAWNQRQTGQDYESWVEDQGGEAWMGDLFDKGCTIIPTFDAYNGYNVVNETFELEDVWPGRAVAGLHEVVERRADKAPANTILEVLQPGYVTANTIVPARVVVSDGSKYVSPNINDPAPLVPNLHLPHQRTLDNWEATWIPTHPAHFEVPALWGWDIATGRFLQLNGPLWDPLHYHYACMDIIRKAVKTPLPVEENRWFFAVPDVMHNRFYPVVPMKGFDVIAFEALERRAARSSLPISAVTHVPDQAESCGIGYHPLPLDFEYEVDSYWFPEFHPTNRNQGMCPEHLMGRVCPVIRPAITPEKYADAIEADDVYPWLADKSVLGTPGEGVLNNFPRMLRYLELDTVPFEELEAIMPLPFLAEMGSQRLGGSAQNFWPNIDDVDDLEGIAKGLHEAVWSVREAAFDLVSTRHLVYRSAPHLYRLGWWMGMSPAAIEEAYMEWVERNQAPQSEAEDMQENQQAVSNKKSMPIPMAVVEGE